LKFKQLEA